MPRFSSFFLGALLLSASAAARAAAFTHTTASDFSSGGWWNGLGSSVTATVGDGAVQLASRGAELTSVVTATAVPNSLQNGNAFPMVSWNGRVYIAGGSLGTGVGSNVSNSIAVNSDGTLGSWRAETTLPGGIYQDAMAAGHGRLYVVGGYNSGAQNEVYSVPVNSDGTLGTWVSETSPGSLGCGSAVAVWGERVYVFAGDTNCSSAPSNAVYSAPILSAGTLGSWRSETTRPYTASSVSVLAYNGRMYLMGGGSSNAVYYSSISADGTLGTWTGSGSLPYSGGVYAAVWNGQVYHSPSGTERLYASTVSANGSLGEWILQPVAIPGTTGDTPLAFWNGTMVAADAGIFPLPTSYPVYTIPVNVGGSIGSWTTNATPMASKWSDVDAFVYGGKLHALGGQSDGAWVSSAAAASINGDGSIGSMVVGGGQMAENNNGYRRQSVVINGWVYSLWQNYNSGPAARFEFAQLCSTGTLCGGWQSQVWNGASDGVVLAAHGSTIYAMGGYNPVIAPAGYQTRVDYASVCSTGTMCSAWNSATALPTSRYMGVGAAWNGYLYYATGRDNGSTAATVSYAPINSNGSLGGWNATTSYPSSTEDALGQIWDGVFYIFGAGPTNTANVYGAAISTNGTLGAWVKQTSLPNALGSSYGGLLATKWKGNIYLVGGDINSGTSNNIYYAGVSSYTGLGTYFNTIDLGVNSALDSVSWTPTLNGGTLAASISTAGATSGFSNWISATNAASVGGSIARYVRYRIDLASSASNGTPVLNDITVNTIVPPTVATPTAVSPTGLTGNWTNNGNAASVTYRVQAATEPTFSSITAAADSGANATSQALTGLPPNATYYVRTIALTGGASSYATRSGFAVSSNAVVGLWHFEEGSGSTAYDWSVNGNTGTLTNAPTWVSGQFGPALSLTGASNQYVSVPDSPSVRLGANNFTIAAWFKTSADGMLIDKSNSSPFQFYQLSVKTGKLWGAASDCGTGACGWLASRNPVVGNTVVTDGKWHYAALTRNGAALSLYLDGALDASHSDSSAWNTDSAAILALGTASPTGGGPASSLTGTIDEIFIASRAFSATEIRQAMGSWPATTPMAPPLISTPTAVTTTGLTVNWLTNGNAASMTYRVQASTEPTFTTVSATADSAANATSQALTGLGSNTTYYTRAVALYGGVTNYAATSGYALSSGSVVGIWHFEDGSGTSASDSSGNGNAGTLNGSPSWSTGRFGTALSFNGSSSYVEMPKSASLNLSGSAVTIAAWIMIQGDGVNYGRIYLGGAVNTTYELVKGNAADDRMLFVPKGSGGLYSNTALSRNVWHHVVGTYDGSTSRIYIDGSLDNSVSESGAIPTNVGTAVIGGETAAHGGLASWFNGLIDEVFVASRTLSATEVRQLFGSWPAKTGPCTGPFTFSFTDPTLNPRASVIRAVHVNELRSDINTLRADASLSAYSWTTPSISSGANVVRAVDITDLRTALNAVYAACGQSAPSYTDSTLTSGATPVRAVHVTDLRTAVQGAK